MANDSSSRGFSERSKVVIPRLIPLLLLLIPTLYLLTLARTVVFGDPTEYTFVANILGIAHPPGYPVITLLGKAFQTLIPFGDIPWRMHLLSAAAAFAAAFFVYGTVGLIARAVWEEPPFNLDKILGIITALTVATSVNVWQHAIHANPHIITATFLAANLFFLSKWWSLERGTQNSTPKSQDRWLYIFSFSVGLGVTHHPLTAFSLPAFAVFILLVRPSIWRQWQTWLKMLAFVALGLAVWLYFPIRSAMGPEFGPHDMNTLTGFLDHVLARGLTESLPFFGLADQADRALVFWTLLRLQYSLATILLAVCGLLWLLIDPLRRRSGAVRPSFRPLGIMIGLVLLTNYVFVINLRQQDVMAYLLGIFVVIGLLSGLGLLAVLDLLNQRIRLELRSVALLIGAVFLLGPVLQVARNAPVISLADYDTAAMYQEAVFQWFEGSDQGAVLLNDWEHMTPLWYLKFVKDRWPDPVDVEPRLVSTDRPWLQSVFDTLPAGPVYLSGYKPEIVTAGFRLRPRGPFYQVVEPGDTSLPPELNRLQSAASGDLQVEAFLLPKQKLSPGEFVPLVLAMQSPAGTEDFYSPVVYVGQDSEEIVYEFTTDSHLVSPEWLPREIIVERFDFALPGNLEPGVYPISLQLRNLTTSQDSGPVIPLGELQITGTAEQPTSNSLLANFRQQIGLVGARARNGLTQRRQAPWSDPLRAEPGDVVHLTLEWKGLAKTEESHTVFVHLIDLANRPIVALDYTPLGGSTPTHLWIPKWLPGQRMLDPYQMKIPADLPDGDYLIEVGLYEMTSGRRLHISDSDGNLAGDRYILGPLKIESAAES